MKTAKSVSVLIALLLAFMPVLAFANAAEPPNLTIVVSNAPEDLELYLRFPDGKLDEPVLLSHNSKAWESYYRFFSGGIFNGDVDFNGAVLIVESTEKSFECSLSEIGDDQNYNRYATLDFSAETIKNGVLPLRTGLLIAMRVILTLIIEGAVFWLFGYRAKKSWLLFLVLNLITQGFVNFQLTGLDFNTYWLFGYAFMEAIVFVAELLFYVLLIKEKSGKRAALCSFCANAASLVLGGILISYFPS